MADAKIKLLMKRIKIISYSVAILSVLIALLCVDGLETETWIMALLGYLLPLVVLTFATSLLLGLIPYQDYPYYIRRLIAFYGALSFYSLLFLYVVLKVVLI